MDCPIGEPDRAVRTRPGTAREGQDLEKMSFAHGLRRWFAKTFWRTALHAIRAMLAASAATAIAVATPAVGAANEVLEGTYVYQEQGGPPLQWQIWPVCVPVVGDLREPLKLPVGCTLNVAVQSNWDRERQSESAGILPVPGGSARPTNGLWTYSTTRAEGMMCPDGTKARAEDVISFDGKTLSGTRKTLWRDACGRPPGMSERPFTLTYEKPLPYPVNRYPLICEPGGLRRCY
jgi:hypothetical protein